MTKNDVDFDTYFETLQIHVADRAGAHFSDEAAIREDYEAGRNVFDVIDEICAEYGDDEQ